MKRARQGCFRIAKWIGIGFIGLFVLGFLVNLIAPEEEEAPAVASLQMAEERQAVATFTSTPVDTPPSAPTEAPLPTDTPAPTDTPIPPPTATNPPPLTTAAPVQQAAPAEPPPPAALPGINGVELIIVENYQSFEILGLVNRGGTPVDISGWTLTGSHGDDSCTVPGGTMLQAGQTYQIATGESWPAEPGLKCGDKTIWNNEGETIYLNSPVGQMQIHTRG